MEEFLTDDAGEIIEVTTARDKNLDAMSVDELVGVYSWHDAAEKEHRAQRMILAAKIASLSPRTEDGCKTTRVRGETQRVTIEWPDDSWDQSLLKEAWYCYPQFRDEFLVIATLRVKLREFKKMLHEVGSPEYETFKRMVREACVGPRGTPRIVIEK